MRWCRLAAIDVHTPHDYIAIMANLTIRNLDDDVKRALRARAALHGRSMEEEARETLQTSLLKTRAPKSLTLLEAIRGPMEKVGFVDLPEIKRHPYAPVVISR